MSSKEMVGWAAGESVRPLWGVTPSPFVRFRGERGRLDLWDEQREGAVRGTTGKESGYVL